MFAHVSSCDSGSSRGSQQASGDGESCRGGQRGASGAYLPLVEHERRTERDDEKDDALTHRGASRPLLLRPTARPHRCGHRSNVGYVLLAIWLI